MKELSKSNNPKALISTKVIDIITFLDNNGKLAIYTGVIIHRLYCYLEINGDQIKLTTSGQSSHHFGTSFSINNYTATIQPVIEALRI